jgi:hypothetical protein
LYPGNTDIQNGNVKLILGQYPGTTDIQNGKVKLILGMIWSLIGHPKTLSLISRKHCYPEWDLKLILGLIWSMIGHPETLSLISRKH